MQGPVVLDTSVVIKWFRQGEVLAEQALALRDAYLEGQIEVTVPSLLVYELANVLRYKADLATEQVQAAVGSLFDMGLAGLALAESLRVIFVTADERLVRRLESLAFVKFLGRVSGV